YIIMSKYMVLICISFVFNIELYSLDGSKFSVMYRCLNDSVPPEDNILYNVVLIMTDNQGAWTHGCYGNTDIKTPNIDRLAENGVLFTHALSSNPVCSPTRATFLTGLIPSQHG